MKIYTEATLTADSNILAKALSETLSAKNDQLLKKLKEAKIDEFLAKAECLKKDLGV